jgi:shikimate dehydrogenase
MTTHMTINGATRLYAIVGDPVVQVRSPEVYTQHFAEAGVNAILFAAEIKAAQFASAMRGLMAMSNLDGLLVTAPHKTAAVTLADRISTAARIAGAVNALRRESDGSWSGDMFDGAGFVAALLRHGNIASASVLLFGCGGAGAAIAAGLAAERVASITLVDPDRTRAERLKGALCAAFPQCDVSVQVVGAAQTIGGLGSTVARVARKDIVINASVVGMRDGDGLPGAIDAIGGIDTDSIVGDVVLRPLDSPTALISYARNVGARVVTGEDMHRGQMAAILAYFSKE